MSSIFMRLAALHGLDPYETELFGKLLASFENTFDGLGFCLSEEGDLLSQWRGYASDAMGLAIGFSKEYLDELCKSSEIKEQTGFTLKKVEYDPLKQEELAEPFYLKIKKHMDNGALKPPGRKSTLDTRSDKEIEEESEVLRNAYRNLVRELLVL